MTSTPTGCHGPGPEPTTLEVVGDQWCYALVVQAGDDDDDGAPLQTLLKGVVEFPFPVLFCQDPALALEV